jgi:hypothetical protein
MHRQAESLQTETRDTYRRFPCAAHDRSAVAATGAGVICGGQDVLIPSAVSLR